MTAPQEQVSRDAHTPGPWVVTERLSDLQSGTDLYVGTRDRRDELQNFSLTYAEEHVALIFGGTSRTANARLIAAAPALYEALHLLLVVIATDDLISESVSCMQQARAAIAKAEAQP